MATYKEIQKWVQKKYGWQPKTCWIAHCKELKGLSTGSARNRDGPRKHPCPQEKQEPIFCAFRHFKMH